MSERNVSIIVSVLLVGVFLLAGGALAATFSGTVVLDGSSASDGTTFEYEMDEGDEVDNFEVDLTGVFSEDTQQVSFSTDSGGSEAVDIGGNLEPDSSIISVDDFSASSDNKHGGSGTIVSASSQSSNTEYLDYTFDAQTVSEVDVDIYFSTFTSQTDPDIRVYAYLAEGDVASDVFDGDRLGSEAAKQSDQGDTHISTIDVGEQTFDSDTITLGLEVEANGDFAGDAEASWTDDEEVAIISPKPDELTVESNGQTVDLTTSSDADIQLSQGSNNLDVSTGEYGSADWNIETTERTETDSPDVSINGQTVGHDGRLSDGETVSLDVDESWIQEGENTVEVSTSDGSLVDLDHRHDTTGDSHRSTVDSTKWSEEYHVERKFSSAREDVEVSIPFSDRVVAIDDVEYRIDGGDWIEPDRSVLDTESTKLSAEIGAVDEGETVELRATGSKVQVLDGEIEIIEPTVEGDILNSLIEVTESPDDQLRIDVSETRAVDDDRRVLWTAEESYSAETSSVIGSDGSQVLTTNANFGSEFRAVETDVVNPSVSAGDATITDIEEADDRLDFTVDKSDSVSIFEIGYGPFDYNVLYTDEGRMTDEGTGTVELRDAGSYYIEEGDPTPVIGGISGDGFGDTIFGIPAFVWLLGSVVGGIGGSAALARRLGDDDEIDGLTLGVFVAGSLAVVLVATELVTPYSLVDTFVSGTVGIIERLIATVTSGAFAALVGSLALLLGIVVLDQRTGVTVPLPYYVGSSSLTVIVMIEVLSPGVLIESLASGLEDIGALVWLILLGGPILLMALWLRSRRPEIIIGGEDL